MGELPDVINCFGIFIDVAKELGPEFSPLFDLPAKVVLYLKDAPGNSGLSQLPLAEFDSQEVAINTANAMAFPFGSSSSSVHDDEETGKTSDVPSNPPREHGPEAADIRHLVSSLVPKRASSNPSEKPVVKQSGPTSRPFFLDQGTKESTIKRSTEVQLNLVEVGQLPIHGEAPPAPVPAPEHAVADKHGGNATAKKTKQKRNALNQVTGAPGEKKCLQNYFSPTERNKAESYVKYIKDVESSIWLHGDSKKHHYIHRFILIVLHVRDPDKEEYGEKFKEMVNFCSKDKKRIPSISDYFCFNREQTKLFGLLWGLFKKNKDESFCNVTDAIKSCLDKAKKDVDGTHEHFFVPLETGHKPKLLYRLSERAMEDANRIREHFRKAREPPV